VHVCGHSAITITVKICIALDGNLSQAEKLSLKYNTKYRVNKREKFMTIKLTLILKYG